MRRIIVKFFITLSVAFIPIIPLFFIQEQVETQPECQMNIQPWAEVYLHIIACSLGLCWVYASRGIADYLLKDWKE